MKDNTKRSVYLKLAAAAMFTALSVMQAFPVQMKAAQGPDSPATIENMESMGIEQEGNLDSTGSTIAAMVEAGAAATSAERPPDPADSTAGSSTEPGTDAAASKADTSEEPAGPADPAAGQETPCRGAILVKTDGAAAVSEEDTVYYSGEVSLEFSVDQEGTYTASYLEDGRRIEKETTSSSPFLAVLTDSEKAEDPHPVYDAFEISGTDNAGNPLVVSQRPEKAIVIDRRGPVIDYSIDKKTAGIFSPGQEGATCSVFAHDRNGAGVDPDRYFYYIGRESESLDAVRNLPESRWNAIHEKNGAYSFEMEDMSGVIWLRVQDRLGNTSYRSSGELVREAHAPVIRVRITDPDRKEIYACTWQEEEEVRQKEISDYYRTLHVQAAVSELPAKSERRGFSGISRVSWALVPPGTDPASARRSRQDLTVNDQPSTLQELYGNEMYRTCVTEIDPEKLVEKLATGKKGYEKSGSYSLYVWAVDFCGNGEDSPLEIPLLLDVSAPAVTVRMEGGRQYRGQYYYRADRDGQTAEETDAAVTVLAADDRREGGVSSLTAVLRGNRTQEALVRQADPSDTGRIVFTVQDLKKQFGETEQEITITVSAADMAGNQTNLIEKEGTKGIHLENDGKAGCRSGSFIRDAVSPRVTIRYAAAGKQVLHVYREEKEGAEQGSFAVYTCGSVLVTCETDEPYAGEDCLFWNISGLNPSEGPIRSGRGTDISLSAAEGEEESFVCTAYGTDIAGNPAMVEERLAEDSEMMVHPRTLALEEVYSAAGCRDKGDHVPAFRLVVDRKAPEITLAYTIHPGAASAGEAFVYDEHEPEGNELTAYLSGSLTVRAIVKEEEGEMDFSRLFFVNPGQKALPWDQAAAGYLSPEEKEKDPESNLGIALASAERDGRYQYRVYGTDRAGNWANVTERFDKDSRLKKMYTEDKGLSCRHKNADENYRPYYALVIDQTSPTYSFSINPPSDPRENYDRRTGIAYYGKAVPSIRAKFMVTEQNFDEERILAGIASQSPDAKRGIEGLSPAWTMPDRKGKPGQEGGLLQTVFPLQIEVDRQHEGMYRFEIAGCDKAGNTLLPSREQAEKDRSDKAADLLSKTGPCEEAEGGFWTQRKAVDVTPPTGVLKVTNSGHTGVSYYELRFEPGGNIPVRYEPFVRDRQARLVVNTEDLSPTSICFDLRSEDEKKDTDFKKKNPIRTAGQNIYQKNNALEMTVKGEQVFYLQNLIIRDRAGNIRANDPSGSCTLQMSGRIYLDASMPDVSAIRDAEAPQIRISASDSFTRHEGDGERYIYRPDGSGLDLEVSVTDPGGKAHSSGLKEVKVEVRVGDRLVTDKVGLYDLPYTYTRGSLTDLNPLRYAVSKARIRIPAGSFAESNDITVTVSAADNSGNESLPGRDGGLLRLGIDTTPPRVEVNYLDTVEPQHGRYFRADRIAEIVVIDRNVGNDKIRIETNASVPAFFTAPHSSKPQDGKGESGNDDRWTKTIRYDTDGDYRLQISGTDALGNRISEIKWRGPAPEAFTIDKTRPVIRLLLPEKVNESGGVRYYDAPVQAVIQIHEHNFSEEMDKDMVKTSISVSNHSGGEVPPTPRRGPFYQSGKDLYTSVVDCAGDGDYEIRAVCRDLAGNEAVTEGGEGGASPKEACSGRFTVDTAAPQIRIDPDTFRVDASTGRPLKGMENQIYTDRNFAPRILIRDTNYDEQGSEFSLASFGRDLKDGESIRKEGDESKGEYSIEFVAFEMARERDGVYKVHADAADLAGHCSSLDFSFSVNRFGSTWVSADDVTAGKLRALYINDTKEPLRILELSPVELKTHTAEVFKDHERRILTEGLQYTFEQLAGLPDAAERKAGRSGNFVYLYTIAPEVYEEERVYDFILSSTDLAGNKNSTALVRDGDAEGKETVQKKFPIELQVDKTEPVNRITGVKKDQEQFNTDSLRITVYPEDYQSDICDVKIRIWKGEKRGKVTLPVPGKDLHYRKIGPKEDAKALAAGRIYPIEKAAEGIPLLIEGDKDWQFLEVITTDLAGNESTDYRAADPVGNLPDRRRRFLVTTNPLIHFYSSGTAFYLIPAVLFPVSGLFLIRKKRKKE